MLINLILFLCIVFGVLYGIQIIIYTIGWLGMKNESGDMNISQSAFSIVIAVRNEEKNIVSLLSDIELQNYGRNKFEVLIVDDQSEDNTFKLVQEFMKLSSLDIKLLGSKGGKKRAVQLGIQESKYDNIITTDGDCRLNNNWLKAINSKKNSGDWIVLAGPVVFTSSKSMFTSFFEFEFSSLIASGAGSVAKEKPIMLNAANLVFEKEVYNSIKENIKEDISSGDDIFLMLAVKEKYGSDKIGFIKSKDAVVRTKAPDSIIEFIHQRIRWATKAKKYTDFNIIYSAVIVGVFNISLFALLLHSLIYLQKELLLLYAALLLFKSLLEFPLLASVNRFMNSKQRVSMIFIFQFFYPVYIFTIGLLSLFIKAQWKGRAVKS